MEKTLIGLIGIGFVGWVLHTAIQKNERKWLVLTSVFALILVMFYLFRFGYLGTFSLKSVLAEAQFVSEKRSETEANAKDVERMKREMQSLMAEFEENKHEISQARDRILSLEGELTKVGEVAKGPILSVSEIQIVDVSGTYGVSIDFKRSKLAPLAEIEFSAAILGDASAHIELVRGSGGGGIHFGEGPKGGPITQNGRRGETSFSILSGDPKLYLQIRGKCKLRVEGNYLADPVEVVVE